MKKNQITTFDCPACGNPLYLSRKPIIYCHFCNTRITTPNFKTHTASEIATSRGKKEDANEA